MSIRIGIGYDSHRMIEGRPLILGGEIVPHGAGLKGHSDGDALCHAITDAILGAAALGDIGRHFPDTDPQFRNANSLGLLARAVGIVHEAGYVVDNVDAAVIEYLAPYRHLSDGFYRWECGQCKSEHGDRACGWPISGQVMRCNKCGQMNLLVRTNCAAIDEALGGMWRSAEQAASPESTW